MRALLLVARSRSLAFGNHLELEGRTYSFRTLSPRRVQLRREWKPAVTRQRWSHVNTSLARSDRRSLLCLCARRRWSRRPRPRSAESRLDPVQRPQAFRAAPQPASGSPSCCNVRARKCAVCSGGGSLQLTQVHGPTSAFAPPRCPRCRGSAASALTFARPPASSQPALQVRGKA